MKSDSASLDGRGFLPLATSLSYTHYVTHTQLAVMGNIAISSRIPLGKG